jgi:hypothetical protein
MRIRSILASSAVICALAVGCNDTPPPSPPSTDAATKPQVVPASKKVGARPKSGVVGPDPNVLRD